jgi:hypothetical protein
MAPPRRISLAEALNGFLEGDEEIISLQAFDEAIQDGADSIGFQW